MTTLLPSSTFAQAGLPDGFEALRRTLAQIHQWNVSSEAVYLGAGEDLQLLHRRIGAVRDCIRRSTEVVTSPEADRVESLLGTAATSAASLEELAIERSSVLRTLADGVSTAAAGSTAVALVFRLLDYVVLVARTHVEGMTQARDVLVPFTQHVHELVGSGQSVARALDERVRLLAGHIGESRAIDARVGAKAMLGEPSLAFQFRTLGRSLAQERDAVATTRAEAHRSFSAIRDAVGGLVMGLQFHDIARQRLEHTLGNLERLFLIAETGQLSHDGAPLEGTARNLALRRIVELEIAQIESLTTLYETKMGDLHGNLEIIAGEIAASDRLLGQLFSDDSDGAGQSAIAVLEREAGKVRARFSRDEVDRQHLDHSLRECVEAAGPLIEMTDELAALEHTLRLAGFNAAVRAAHVDSGDETIGYIAREIREQASLAKAQADLVREGIEVAVSATRELEGAILPKIGSAEGEIASQFAEATGILQRIDAECLDTLREASVNARGLGAKVEAITALMTPHVEGCGLMRQTIAILRQLLAGLPDEAMSAEEGLRLYGLLAAQYTMAEERAIFEASFRAMGLTVLPSAVVNAAPPPPADDVDDFLF
ncbi:hypothetical protein [Aureimonas pseudogalii]|uniref:Chemotaxis protein n=1 Tax=Aureimonas pseudogalii TaxID=1744844 RepID=A0A7W6H713_9HYPH|nr:hypothetical protein [Aureimonas pseudogalii]MBB3999623.1 hypothetical protein [Aureimonas pseudogalii]